MSETKQFYNMHGELTSYGLACGYIQKTENVFQTVVLWREHGKYHVRRHNHFRNKRVFWETFDTLTPARKLYNHHAKEIKSLCFIPA